MTYNNENSGYHSNPDIGNNSNSNFPQYYESGNYRTPKTNGYATAALVIGILSLVLLCTVFVPMVIGPLGIIFGLLSKKENKKTGTTAKIGIGLSTGGFCASLIIIGMALSITLIPYLQSDDFQQYWNDFQQLLESTESNYNNENYQELYENILEDLYNFQNNNADGTSL